MKLTQLNLFLLFFAGQLFSQNENVSSRYAVKIYNLSSFGQDFVSSADTSVFGGKSLGKKMSIFHPTFAFQLRGKNGNYHELELINVYRVKNPIFMEIFLDSTQTNAVVTKGAELTSTYCSFRYEYQMSFKTEEDPKMEFSLGFGINPYVSSRKFDSFTSTVFNRSERSIGFRTYVVPRINYYLTSRFFLDLNLPIAVADYNFSHFINSNPAIPEQQQSTSNFGFQGIPQLFSARLGLGLKL